MTSPLSPDTRLPCEHSRDCLVILPDAEPFCCWCWAAKHQAAWVKNFSESREAGPGSVVIGDGCIAHSRKNGLCWGGNTGCEMATVYLGAPPARKPNGWVGLTCTHWTKTEPAWCSVTDNHRAIYFDAPLAVPGEAAALKARIAALEIEIRRMDEAATAELNDRARRIEALQVERDDIRQDIGSLKARYDEAQARIARLVALGWEG